MLLDDAVDCSQPESGALADLFGRKEGFEQAVAHDRIDAAAGIGHSQADVVAGPRAAVFGDEAHVHAERERADDQRSAARHGVPER